MVVCVESIAEPECVYDITVADNHNFFADGILVHNCFDDPHNVKKAESEAERQQVIDWWDGTMSSRGILHDAASIGVMQRLNCKDLSAHCLTKAASGAEWDHLCFPMRFEADHPTPVKSSLGFRDPRQPGELLWPVALPERKVLELEAAQGEYFSAGQLQQRPHPRGGGMFKQEWFTSILPEIPNDVAALVRYLDKAGTAGGQGARTALVLVGRRRNGRFVVIDVVKGRWSSADREAVVKATILMDAQRYGRQNVATWIEQEPGSGGKESAENTVLNNAGYRVSIERVTGAKEVRAEPAANQCAVGNVDLVLGPWNAEFIEECCSFPSGSLRDQVDAFGGALNKLTIGTGAFGSSSELAAPTANREGFQSDRLETTRIGSGFF